MVFSCGWRQGDDLRHPASATPDRATATRPYPGLGQLFRSAPVTERTNEDWLRSLGGTADEAAVAELREVLRRRLRRTGRPGRRGRRFIEDVTQEEC